MRLSLSPIRIGFFIFSNSLLEVFCNASAKNINP
jgi:hypothetical protein